MFPIHRKIKNPEVIMPLTDKISQRTSYERQTLLGTFYNVTPTTEREVMALRMLDHRVDKFAPAQGEGVILTAESFQKFQPTKP
jgi:hypothetical protein